MSQRVLFGAGAAAIAAALLIGVVGITAKGGVPMMGWRVTPAGQSISIDQAQRSVQSFLDRTGNRDLTIDELMEFDQNFYALVKEKSTGIGAFELLVNKSSGAVGFEPGPNMMWNTKYSMMGGGMMRGGFGVASSSGPMPVSADQATRIAQGWLDRRFSGDSAGDADAFYGYYTFHFKQNGQIAGMLSVNGYSGQVWFHTWHGSFVQAKDFGA
ncbi:MAG TPA: hypothetical protein VFL29_11895 [Candidatus Dormibacteraeota bacterium]|nr:hypothetical protein [Candidatus Dormibacteraeota bacterium]